jgi:hypothetical protein
MTTSKTGLLTGAAATLLVVAVTLVQGIWTERWTKQADDTALRHSAELLERDFPRAFGEWRFLQDMETSPEELARAGAVGSIARVFSHAVNKTAVSAFVVCATPHDASGHTPDRCYPGAGFEIGESEHRQTVRLEDGREAEVFTGTFRKTGQTLRVFWTYGIPGSADAKGADGDEASGTGGRPLHWVAPQIARIALNGEPFVYKLYAIVDQTKLGSSQATFECTKFLAGLLPAFDAALVADKAGPGADGQPAAESSAADASRPG